MSPYVPEDGKIAPESLAYLASAAGTALREAAARVFAVGGTASDGSAAGSVAAIGSVRNAFEGVPVGHIQAALTLGRLQEKARRKFPALPYVWATPEALEQATGMRVALHKADQFRKSAEAAGVPVRCVWDLCCGMGGDALALAEHIPVIAVDLSPTRAMCVTLNGAGKRIEVRCGDIREWLGEVGGADLVHIDPARRSGGKRSHAFGDLVPGWEVFGAKLQRAAGWAVKMSPGVEFCELPPGHLELLSSDRSVVQAVLWGGCAARWLGGEAKRTATVLGASEAFGFTATPGVATLRGGELLGQFLVGKPPAGTVHLYEVDGALTRAQVAGAYAESRGWLALTGDGGYVLSAPGAEVVRELAAVPFVVRGAVAYSEGRVATALRAMGGEKGVVEVKSRGHVPGMDADKLQKVWTKEAGVRRTVFVFSQGREAVAVIGDRV